MRWKDWAGFHAAASYDVAHDSEYFAFRHAAGLTDISPLFKYDVDGTDTAPFLAYLLARDVSGLKPGQMAYCCWCDDDGKLIDDGTVAHIAPNHFRITAAEPMLSWFSRLQHGFDVHVEDSTMRLAALSLQGPTSLAILNHACQADIGDLPYFNIARVKLGGMDIQVSRTGYTGDLGYEIWMENRHALGVWDCLAESGKLHGIQPAGLDALDVARIEAGFIMNGVDYFSAHHCLIESRKSSPYERGLGWMVDLDRERFMGQLALEAEKRHGSRSGLVGLEIAWNEYEELCDRHEIPAQAASGAWRTPVPLYNSSGNQIGKATSGAWSPTLKKSFALGSVEARYRRPGTQIKIEATVEYQRHRITATVVPRPFLNPGRKRR